jgi:hypothetical protein
MGWKHKNEHLGNRIRGEIILQNYSGIIQFLVSNIFLPKIKSHKYMHKQHVTMSLNRQTPISCV